MDTIVISLISGGIGALVGGLFSLLIYRRSLQKELLFRLQEKGEELVKLLYQYQDNITTLEIEGDNLDITNNEIKTEIDLNKSEQRQKIYRQNLTKQQNTRDTIWSLIKIYFPQAEHFFREYTNIEINHKKEDEYNEETIMLREKKLGEIAEKIFILIDIKRKKI